MSKEHLDNELAWVAAHAEKTLRDEARKDDVSAEEKAVLDSMAERRGQQGLEKYLRDKESGTEQLEWKEVKEIMGDKFLGPEEVAAAFGIDIDQMEIPQVPFTRQFLKDAKENGFVLIFRVGEAPKGKPLTYNGLSELVKDHFRKKIADPLLQGSSDGFENEKLSSEWKLVRSIPLIYGNDFFEAAIQLRDYLGKKGWIDSAEIEECSNRRISELQEELKIDSKAAVEKLVNLKLVRNHVRSVTEARYDNYLFMLARGSKDPLTQEEEWTRTSATINDHGFLMTTGHFWDIDRGAPIRAHSPSSSGLDYRQPTVYINL